MIVCRPAERKGFQGLNAIFIYDVLKTPYQDYNRKRVLIFPCEDDFSQNHLCFIQFRCFHINQWVILAPSRRLRLQVRGIDEPPRVLQWNGRVNHLLEVQTQGQTPTYYIRVSFLEDDATCLTETSNEACVEVVGKVTWLNWAISLVEDSLENCP